MNLTKQSLMSLYMEIYRDNELISTGTAFTVAINEKCFLVTNRHNVTGRHLKTGDCLDINCSIPNKLRIFFIKNLKKLEWSSFDLSLFKDEDERTPSWFEHSIHKNKIDIVAFQLSQNLQHVAYDLNQPLDIKVKPSDCLNVIGFPFGKSVSDYIAIWITGFLGSDFDVDFEQLPCFLLDARTRPGQSGSPVIAFRTASYTDLHGKLQIFSGEKVWLYGIYSGRIDKNSDLGIVWKVSAIKELVDAPSPGTN